MGGASQQPSVPQKQTEEVPLVLPLGTSVGKTHAGTSFPARLCAPKSVDTLHLKSAFEHRSALSHWLPGQCGAQLQVLPPDFPAHDAV